MSVLLVEDEFSFGVGALIVLRDGLIDAFKVTVESDRALMHLHLGIVVIESIDWEVSNSSMRPRDYNVATVAFTWCPDFYLFRVHEELLVLL